MRNYKKVLLPVEVPFGIYCWSSEVVCPRIDNQSGYPICNLNFFPLITDKLGNVLKPKECKDLKEIK